jgi:hypothetical protein
MPFSLPILLRRKRCTANSLVIKSFNLKFPKAKHILWQQLDVFKWHVNFTFKEEKFSALFNSEGDWMETITLIPINKVPEALQLTFEEKYNRDDLQKVFYIETPAQNIYEMNLDNGLYTFKVLYDTEGKIIGTLIS